MPHTAQLVKVKYFHAPCVVEFTVPPDEESTYEERTRALQPVSHSPVSSTLDTPVELSLKYFEPLSYQVPLY